MDTKALYGIGEAVARCSEKLHVPAGGAGGRQTQARTMFVTKSEEPTMSKNRKPTTTDNGTDAMAPITTPKSLVFISHDTRDAEYAEAFSVLLSNVSCGMLKSFRSSDKSGRQGLEFGTEWYPEIMKHLEQASDVVCLLTENSLGRPWILYEAGVAKGKLGTPVHGLALGVPLEKASTGPFAQFTNCGGDAESVATLVMQLAKKLPNADPQKSMVDPQVAEFRKRIDELVKKSSSKPAEVPSKKMDESTTAKLFEEVKVMFQELPERMESRVIRALEPRRRHKRGRDPMMLMDYMIHVAGKEIEPATAWLITISQFREEVPWAYELGMQVYRALEAGKPSEARRAMDEFRNTMNRLMHRHLVKSSWSSKARRCSSGTCSRCWRIA